MFSLVLLLSAFIEEVCYQNVFIEVHLQMFKHICFTFVTTVVQTTVSELEGRIYEADMENSVHGFESDLSRLVLACLHVVDLSTLALKMLCCGAIRSERYWFQVGVQSHGHTRNSLKRFPHPV